MPFLSYLNPVPAFPAYSGPYDVGTQDVETPVSHLSSPAIAPDPSITTVSFRLFYPCIKPQKSEAVYWLPEPQTEYWQAYARFLQAAPWLASVLSYVPLSRLLFHITIPACRDAKILSPPVGIGKWPVMVFSHGLGGTRNAYSHICGSLASHGIVVVAVEHRDGSAPITFLKESFESQAKVLGYKKLPHDSSQEVERSRNHQLAVRCWETGLVHSALLKLDSNESLLNTRSGSSSNTSRISTFASTLDVQTPGKISWAGHSFGAATMYQFIKSVFHGGSTLYTPLPNSVINTQITSTTPLILLDMWAQPLLSESTSSLFSKPLPAYTVSNGARPLAILSESFFKWKANLSSSIRAISPPENDNRFGQKPHVFYVATSAHLSQSDFGPLFPFLTRKVFKAEDPERTLQLNVRAVLEVLRECGIGVADAPGAGGEDQKRENKMGKGRDWEILGTEGKVKGWACIPASDNDEDSSLAPNGRIQNGHTINGGAKEDFANGNRTNGHAVEAENPTDAVVKGEVLKP